MSESSAAPKEPKKRKRQKAVDPNHADVDCTSSEAKLWLVKVPKYLGQKWLDSNTPEVGKLSIKDRVINLYKV